MAGYEPFVEDVFLTRGATFVHYFECTTDDPFPDDTTAVFRVLTRDASALVASFPAVLVEPGGIQVQIGATDLDNIPDGYRWQLRIRTPDQPTTCWRRGSIWRRD